MENRSFFKDLWRLIYPILIYVGITYVITYLAIVFVVMKDSYAAMMALPANTTYQQIQALAEQYTSVEAITHYQAVYLNYYRYVDLAVNLTLFPVVLLLYLLDRRKEKKEWHLSQVYSYWYGIPFVMGIGLCLFVTMIVRSLQAYGSNATTSVTLVSMLAPATQSTLARIQASIAFRVLSLGIVGPVTQELLFRGILYKRSRRWRGVIMSTIWSILLFGMTSNGTQDIFFTILVSIFACYVYEKYRNIVAPIVLHVGACLLSIVFEMNAGVFGEILSGSRVMICAMFGLVMIATCIVIIQTYVNVWRDEQNETIDNHSSSL